MTLPPGLDGDGPARLLGRASVAAALAALDAEGEETRLVGGCVRDALLGHAAADIDLATTHRPQAVMARAASAGLKAHPTGIDHGTVTVLAAGETVEVTTLREDIETDGRHAVVRFGRDFRADAGRRDFTMNALSLGPDGRLHDTTGGLTDLAAGRVRFIGDPATRIREDALRVLRFFRFHARFGRGAPDAGGLAACVAARASLDRLSRERVRAEFLKLLLAPGAVEAVAVMGETGLLARVTGGVAELGRLARAHAAGGPATLRLAALAVQSRADAERLRHALRLSRAEAGLLEAYADALAALRSRAVLEPGPARALAAEHGAEAVRGALTALAGEPRPRVTDEARAALAALAGDGAPHCPVAGADLVARGLPPGPGIGLGLAAARRLWLDRGCPMDDGSRDDLIAHALAAVRAAAP